MSRRKTAEEAAWLAERYPSMANAELLEAFRAEFGWAPAASGLATWASDLGLRKAGRSISWAGHPEYDEFLRGAIPGRSERQIADAFEGRFGIHLTRPQVKNAKTRLGIGSGTAGGRFEPGQRAWNKGVPQSEWMSAESIERTKRGRFARGHAPWNSRALPVGSERVTADGYVEVKVAERPSGSGPAHDNWRGKHIIAWERENGPLPPGMAVLFADGDKRNFDPENLVAVTRAENIGLNRIGRPYADRETLMDALKIVRLDAAIGRAERRPRRCATCGAEFAPRYRRQRRCDACLAASGSAPDFGWAECPVCGRRFRKANGRQRYCSAACRERAGRAHG